MFIESIARGKEYSGLVVYDVQLPVKLRVSVGTMMEDVSEGEGVFCRLWGVGMRREKRSGASRNQNVLVEADITADDSSRARGDGKGRCQQQRGGDPASRTASRSRRYHGANLA